MSAKVNPGLGTVLKATYGTPTPSLQPIAQRVKLDGPELTVGTAETTNLDSTVKTYRPTIPDSGKISGTLQYDPQDTSHLALFALYTTPATNAMALAFADTSSTVFNFTGILTKLKPTGIEVESNLEAEFEIQITGAVTHTP